jgi:hypothetical protein
LLDHWRIRDRIAPPDSLRHEFIHCPYCLGFHLSLLSTIQAPSQSGNGGMVDVEGWVFKFTEVVPPTGDTVSFAFGKDVRDMVVRELTGGIVLPDGSRPIEGFEPA